MNICKRSITREPEGFKRATETKYNLAEFETTGLWLVAQPLDPEHSAHNSTVL